MVTSLIFRSLIHFQLIFIYGVRKYSNIILLQVAIQFSQHHLLIIFSLLYIFVSFIVNRLTLSVWVYFWAFILMKWQFSLGSYEILDLKARNYQLQKHTIAFVHFWKLAHVLRLGSRKISLIWPMLVFSLFQWKRNRSKSSVFHILHVYYIKSKFFSLSISIESRILESRIDRILDLLAI